MVEIVITKADCWHAEALAKWFREHEEFEFSLLPKEAAQNLTQQLEKSDSYVALVDGQPACIWGFRDHSLSGTHLWMVTGKLVDKYPKRFLRESKKIVRDALPKHQLIYGYVDVKYEVSCRWMEWIGFEPVGKVDFQDIQLFRYEMRA